MLGGCCEGARGGWQGQLRVEVLGRLGKEERVDLLMCEDGADIDAFDDTLYLIMAVTLIHNRTMVFSPRSFLLYQPYISSHVTSSWRSSRCTFRNQPQASTFFKTNQPKICGHFGNTTIDDTFDHAVLQLLQNARQSRSHRRAEKRHLDPRNSEERRSVPQYQAG